jgi:methylenetetrahydrofolate dehydrogenase (NADP+)/methenyltetrahydrofolate cyclohydrolase
LNAGVTVSICHKASRDVSGMVKRADVVVAAAGVAHLVK